LNFVGSRFFAPLMHQIAVPYFNDITIWHSHVKECAYAVWEAAGWIKTHVGAFIDGTMAYLAILLTVNQNFFWVGIQTTTLTGCSNNTTQ
jgi:hypothetical protein